MPAPPARKATRPGWAGRIPSITPARRRRRASRFQVSRFAFQVARLHIGAKKPVRMTGFLFAYREPAKWELEASSLLLWLLRSHVTGKRLEFHRARLRRGLVQGVFGDFFQGSL